MLDIAGHSVSILQLIALGIGVGYFAGMFGIGGGFMLTPALHLIYGIPFPIAVGSGLCQMIGTAASAYRKHRSIGNGDPKFGLLILGSSVIGVDAGTRLLVGLNQMGSLLFYGRSVPAAKFVLEVLFALLLVIIALQFVWINLRRRLPGPPGPLNQARLQAPLARLRLPPYVDLPDTGLRRVSLPVIVYVGFCVGVLSGLMGLGGGVVLIPVLVYGLGFSIHTAAGTGLLPLLVTASVGTVKQAFHGHVHLGLVAALMLGSTFGAQLGALTALRLSAARLWAAFVGVILLTALALVWDISRMLG